MGVLEFSGYKIVNSVISTQLIGDLNLERIALFLEGSQYEPENFVGLILRRPELNATFIIFTTGRFVANSPSVDIGKKAMKAIAKEISSIENLQLTFEDPRIVNLVATMDLGTSIDIESLSISAPCCKYEPEQFPGAICYLKEKVVLLVFASGKVNCVGAKNEIEISEARQWLEKRVVR